MPRPSLIPPREILTDRLRLRVPVRADARAIYDGYARDPQVTRFLTWSPHRTIAETRAFLAGARDRWRSGAEYTFAITLRRSGRLVGMIGLRLAPPKADLGYVIAPAYTGKGYATEAARALASWAIAQGPLHRVWAICDTRNAASARVLEKIGMTREGTLRRWMYHADTDQPADCLCYALVKEGAA